MKHKDWKWVPVNWLFLAQKLFAQARSLGPWFLLTKYARLSKKKNKSTGQGSSCSEALRDEQDMEVDVEEHESDEEDIPTSNEICNAPPGYYQAYETLMQEKYRGREHERPKHWSYIDWAVWAKAGNVYRNGRIPGMSGNLIIREDYDGHRGARVNASQATVQQQPPRVESTDREAELELEYAEFEAMVTAGQDMERILAKNPDFLSNMKRNWMGKRPSH